MTSNVVQGAASTDLALSIEPVRDVPHDVVHREQMRPVAQGNDVEQGLLFDAQTSAIDRYSDQKLELVGLAQHGSIGRKGLETDGQHEVFRQALCS